VDVNWYNVYCVTLFTSGDIVLLVVLLCFERLVSFLDVFWEHEPRDLLTMHYIAQDLPCWTASVLIES